MAGASGRRDTWNTVRRSLLWLMCCAALVGAGELSAQTRADSAAVLLHAADQLRLRGETGAARAVLDLIARQYAGTPAAMEVARMRDLLRRTPDAERSGRTELLVFGTSYGAWLGLAVPLATESTSPTAYGIGLLLGAPAGFLAARTYVSTKNPTEGQARALTFGGSWGTYQGIALATLFDWGRDTEVFCDPPDGPCFEFETDAEASTYVTAAVLGGLAGIGVGALLARRPITAGTAAATTLGGLWGTWFGFGISYLADLQGDDLLAGTLAGGNAALLGVGLVAPRWQMSESRARLISVGGLIGGLGGLGVMLIVRPEGDRAPLLFPLVGSGAGLGLAAHWTRTRDDDPPGSGRGALLNRSDGQWSLDAPATALRMQRAPDGQPAPAVYVPIFNIRF